MSTTRDGKGRTGLEWLLDEARKPAVPKESERPPRPDPMEAALAGLTPAEPAAPEKPEPWAVVPLQPVPEEPTVPLPSRESMRSNALDATMRVDPDPVAEKPAAPKTPAVLPGDAPDLVPTKAARDLRAQPRAVIAFEVRYKKGSEAIVGLGRNISRSGMFVETKKFLPDNDVFQLQLSFPEPHNRRMSVIAEVIWATSGDPEDFAKHPSGMGLKFLDVDDKDVPFLASLVAKK